MPATTASLAAIIQRASFDLGFRAALIDDPDRALAAAQIQIDERVRASLLAYVRVARR